MRKLRRLESVRGGISADALHSFYRIPPTKNMPPKAMTQKKLTGQDMTGEKDGARVEHVNVDAGERSTSHRGVSSVATSAGSVLMAGLGADALGKELSAKFAKSLGSLHLDRAASHLSSAGQQLSSLVTRAAVQHEDPRPKHPGGAAEKKGVTIAGFKECRAFLGAQRKRMHRLRIVPMDFNDVCKVFEVWRFCLPKALRPPSIRDEATLRPLRREGIGANDG
eukprot:Rmarinus@m.13115